MENSHSPFNLLYGSQTLFQKPTQIIIIRHFAGMAHIPKMS